MLSILKSLTDEAILVQYSSSQSPETLLKLAKAITVVHLDHEMWAYVSDLNIAQQSAVVTVLLNQIGQLIEPDQDAVISAINTAIQGYWIGHQAFTAVLVASESRFSSKVVQANINRIHFSLALLQSMRTDRVISEWVAWIKIIRDKNEFTAHYTLAETLPELDKVLSLVENHE